MADTDARMLRQRFEEFFADSRRNRGRRHAPTFERLADGTYRDDSTQRHWWTWQKAILADWCRRAAPPQDQA